MNEASASTLRPIRVRQAETIPATNSGWRTCLGPLEGQDPSAPMPPVHLAGGALLGRSHRSKPGKARLSRLIGMIREILEVPDSQRIRIVPASDSGAVEIALWSLLGERPVEVLAWESFGPDWLTDVTRQLRLDAVVHTADYGELPD